MVHTQQLLLKFTQPLHTLPTSHTQRWSLFITIKLSDEFFQDYEVAMVDLLHLKSEQRHKNARQACIFPSRLECHKMPHERLQSWVFWLCHMLRKCSGLHPPSVYPVIHPAVVPTAPQGSWWRALWSGFCTICVRCCWGFLGGVEGGGCLEWSRERSVLIIAWAEVCVLTSLL